ncbi:MAG TPA: hypothetical protein VGR78_16385 [Verrucomicrobiae bacterium]|jgi:CheY-like chemotaxis protein|nr:hypothetical protein [Verrucomicrobiae bacterium]
MANPTICAVVEQDLRLIRRLREFASDCGFNLHITRSSEETILYFRDVGIYGDRAHYPLPSMTVLDTGNEGASDLELLGWLRQERQFRKMPIVLLAREPPHKVRVACALDTLCFLADRETLWELPGLAWRLLFISQPSAAEEAGRAKREHETASFFAACARQATTCNRWTARGA